MYCKKCGKEANENERFCTSCGTPLLSDAVDSNKESETEKPAVKRSKKPILLIVGICVAVVVVIGIVVGFLALTPFGQEISSDLGIEVFDEPEYRESKITTKYRNGLTTTETFSYDSEGRNTSRYKTEEYKDDSGEVQTAEYKENFTYISDTDWIYERAVTNAQDADENETFQSRVHETLNDKGDPIESTTVKDDGSIETSSTTYEYYPNGEKKSYVRDYTYDGKNSDELQPKHQEVLFNENGNVLEYRIEHIDGTINAANYTYTADGTLASEVRRYTSNTYDDTTTYQYDEFGNAISEMYEDGTVCEYELTLDDEGRVLRRVEPQISYEKITSGKVVEEYQYDSNGNVIYEKYQQYQIDSDEPDDFGYEEYTEYVRI